MANARTATNQKNFSSNKVDKLYPLHGNIRKLLPMWGKP